MPPTLQFKAELDASGFSRGVEDATRSLEKAKAAAGEVTAELAKLAEQRAQAQALTARLDLPGGFEKELAGVSTKELFVASTALKVQEDFARKLLAGDENKRLTLEKRQVAFNERVITAQRKLDRELEDEADRHNLTALRQGGTQQDAARRMLLATGAAQIASAAGVPIPGGATLLGGGLRGAAGLAVGVGVAVAATAAIRQAVISTSEWISRMEVLAETTGSTAEALSTFSVAVDRLGGNSEALGPALAALRQNMVANATEFEQLGIKTKTATGEQRNALEVLREVRDIMGQAAPGAERDALGVRLVGDAYLALKPALNATATEWAAMLEVASKSSKVVGDDAVKANREYLTSLKDIETQMEGLKTWFGAGIAEAITNFSSNVRMRADQLKHLLQGDFEGAGGAREREIARRDAEVELGKSKGTMDPGKGLNLDPYLVAFNALDAQQKATFDGISAGATSAAQTMNVTMLSAVDGLRERFLGLSRAGLLTGQQQQVALSAQALGLSEDQLDTVFAAATDTVGQGTDQLIATIRQRQVGAFDKLLFDTIVGGARDQLKALDDQIASIDERLSEIAARRKEADTFDPGQQSAELRAREEERIFTPTRPGEDDDTKQIGRLQKERALLQTRRDLLAADVEARLGRYELAQANLKAAEASRLATEAEQKAATESKRRWTEARLVVQGLKQDLDDLRTSGGVTFIPAVGGPLAPVAMDLRIDITSSDRSLSALDTADLNRIFGERLANIIANSYTKVRRGIGSSASGGTDPMIQP